MKLSLWKGNYLSLGGRITLIKACLSNLPIFCMSLFNMARAMGSTLDILRRNFMWEWQGERRIHPL